MRKPNYNMERKDRERAKQAKAAAKLEKRSANKGSDSPDAAGTSATDDLGAGDQATPKPGEG
jgi:hypothetical protein